MATKRKAIRKTQESSKFEVPGEKTWIEWYASLQREPQDWYGMGFALLMIFFLNVIYPLIAEPTYDMWYWIATITVGLFTALAFTEQETDMVEWALAALTPLLILGFFGAQISNGVAQAHEYLPLVFSIYFGVYIAWELFWRADLYYFEAKYKYREKYGVAALLLVYIPSFPVRLILNLLGYIFGTLIWGTVKAMVQGEFNFPNLKFWKKFDFAKLKPKIPTPSIKMPSVKAPSLSRSDKTSSKAEELLISVMEGRKEASELPISFGLIYNRIFRAFNIETENGFRVDESTAKDSLELIKSNSEAWNALIELVGSKLQPEKPAEMQKSQAGKQESGVFKKITQSLPSMPKREPRGNSGDDTGGKGRWISAAMRKKSPEEERKPGRRGQPERSPASTPEEGRTEVPSS